MVKKKSAYAKAGVDIEKADQVISLMKKDIKSTYTPSVLSDVGAFGGLFDLFKVLKDYEHPVLVSSIDGVGTKTMIDDETDQWTTVGQCIVHHCVNDILVQGARPLFFLDYMAADQLKPEIMAGIVKNMAIACKTLGIPIIGGETAEMPGIYKKGRHDVVGAIVGVVDKSKIIDGSKIKEGDVLIGLRSNGIHTNGMSLARKAFFETRDGNPKSSFFNPSGSITTVGEELLRIHKCYLLPVSLLLNIVHGIAHITGGGLIYNIARILPEGLRAEISQEWKIPDVFKNIQEIESISDEEMRKVFNLGIGIVLIVPFEQVQVIRSSLYDFKERDHVLMGTINEIDPQKKEQEKVVFTY